MMLKDLVNWKGKGIRNGDLLVNDSFDSFHRGVERLFAGFFDEFGQGASSLFGARRSSFSPRIDLSEDDAAIFVSVELPGLDEKDIQVSLKDQMLTIKGEKKVEQDRENSDYVRVERRFGSFQRSVRVPQGIDPDGVKATFKNGILQVTLPKPEKAKEQVRQIEVKTV